jgi:hypothetical protein
MLRYCFLIGFLLLPVQYASAQGTSEFAFGRQHLFFPGTKVVMRCHCPDKTQVSWSIESADRKLQSGIAKVRDDLALVEFVTPPLKDGVMLELKLVVDGQSQPLFLVSRDVFAEQRDWLGELNIILLDGDDGIASDILKEAEIPFTTTVDASTTGALILITRKEFSMSDYYRASRGNYVVVIAPEKLEMVVPQMSRFGAEHSFLLTSYETQIFTDSLKGELPFRIFGNSSYPTGMFFMLKNKEDRVNLQTIGMNSSGTGWNYAEFRFGQRGRLLFVNASLFENWNALPDSQIFLKLLFDEMKSQQKSLNKEK